MSIKPAYMHKPDSGISSARCPHPNFRDKAVGGYWQRGINLIEVIMFIVIIGIALAGVLVVSNNLTNHSADTLVRKQTLALAESLLEEIELQNYATAGGFTGPYTQANRASFDTVTNYNGFQTTAGVVAMDGSALGLGNYNYDPAVTVVATTLKGVAAYVITVSVTGPGGRIDVTGYRTNN